MYKRQGLNVCERLCGVNYGRMDVWESAIKACMMHFPGHCLREVAETVSSADSSQLEVCDHERANYGRMDVWDNAIKAGMMHFPGPCLREVAESAPSVDSG